MYIDFHYYMIKVLAVKAGFSPAEAEDIAYASEYVDDALEFLPMRIDEIPDFAAALRRADGQFDVACTAHDETTMLGGALTAGQERTYMPFHFVPRDTKAVSKERYDYRTAPNCPVARDLVEIAVAELQAANGDERVRKLIKLGIALHTFADTWAHRDFSGRFSGADNAVANLEVLEDGDWHQVPIDTMPSLVPETGHAKAHSYPDSSHIHWRYYNGETREFFDRNNPVLYLEAARTIYEVLCEAADRPARWDEISNRVEACIRFKPRVNIWEKGGIDHKIQCYHITFPEIFREERSVAADDGYRAEDYKSYDEWKWRVDALLPYRQLPDGRREELNFRLPEFNLRKLQDGPTERLKAHFAGKSAWQLLALGASVLAGEVRPIIAEAAKPLAEWYQTMRSTRYACRPTGIDGRKWFYFNLEAAAQRQYVLDHAYPIGDAYVVPADEMYQQAFTREKLEAQLWQLIKYAATRYTMFKPSPTLSGKAYWMSVTVENKTPYPVIWRGHHEDDFSFSGGHGRYWDRPDRGGVLAPWQSRRFSVCERDNAATGSSGVALFEIDVPHQQPIPFSIAFSQPLLDDELHALKIAGSKAGELVGNLGREIGNAGLEIANGIAGWFGKSVDERIAPVVIKVDKRPKCRASFSTDRGRAYDALDGDTQVANSDSTSFSAGRIMLTTEPDQNARVVISH